MTFIANEFPKLQSAKDVVKQMFKTHCFTRPFESQHDVANTTELCIKAL